jgi:hypothetical protein
MSLPIKPFSHILPPTPHPPSFGFNHFQNRTRAYAGSIPDEVTVIFNLPNPSSRTVALGATQPLTEMSTRDLPGGKGWPAYKTDDFTAICEPII